MKIIMYHYVRPIKESDYPNIRGLELDGFRRQLDYFQANYTIISVDDVVAAVKSGKKLPRDRVWLTFDDGYKDHVEHVLPELIKRSLTGTFFPPAAPVLDSKLLDVNAIHFILERVNDDVRLVTSLKTQCSKHGVDDVAFTRYWEAIDKTSRFDSEAVIFFKRMLQSQLPQSIRSAIINELFEEFLGMSEQEFCQQLYMSEADIHTLLDNGMTVGSHTYNHFWLTNMDNAAQAAEINSSLHFLNRLGVPVVDWIMCYPYGAYNDHTLEILRNKNCALAVTTEVGEADTANHLSLTLPRYDTNDFPQ